MTDLEIAFEETGAQLDRIIVALRREQPTPPTPYVPSSGVETIFAINGIQISTYPIPVLFDVDPNNPNWFEYVSQQSELTITNPSIVGGSITSDEIKLDPSGNNGQYNGILISIRTYMPEPIAWIDSSLIIHNIENSANAVVTWVEPS